MESAQRGQINVQKDGKRKTFTSTKPGCTELVFAGANEQYILKRWHTFVSIAQNLPEGQLRRLVGHSRSMDTYGVYAHAFGDQEASDVQRLDSLFSGIG